MAVLESAIVISSRNEGCVWAAWPGGRAISPSMGEMSGAGNIVSFARLLGLPETKFADTILFVGDAFDILYYACDTVLYDWQ
jgi:hypothetical protein